MDHPLPGNDLIDIQPFHYFWFILINSNENLPVPFNMLFPLPDQGTATFK
jgi:hypothetical protein